MLRPRRSGSMGECGLLPHQNRRQHEDAFALNKLDALRLFDVDCIDGSIT